MSVQDWIHRFPLLKDQFTIFVDWPAAGADTFNNASKQDIFTALAAMQDYLINYYREYISWLSLDGFTTSIDGAGSIIPNVVNLKLISEGVATSVTHLRANEFHNRLNFAGRLVIWDFVITKSTSIATQTIWLHLTASAAAPPAETSNHIGWKIINGDLYASNADGTTQKITDTTFNVPPGEGWTRLRLVLDPGVNCRFYVNGDLKITHTNNLPIANVFTYSLGIRSDVNSVRSISLSPFLLEQAA